MTSLLYLLIYVSVAVFMAACIVRIIQYARTPMHLRWELYPVQHEAKERVEHGGSYLEETDWQERPRRFNLMGEIRFMLPEMLFLKTLHEHNRTLWLRSFPFHFGLYLITFSATLMVVAVVSGLVPTGPESHALAVFLGITYRIAGLAGVALTVAGTLGLLQRRLTDPELRVYTAPVDYFNLSFFLVAIGLIAAGRLTASSGQAGLTSFTSGLVHFDTSIQIPIAMGAGLALTAVLLAYIPMTHMSHFIGKYFTWHKVRWNDTPNLRSGDLERRVIENLSLRPSWRAPHIEAEGNRTWADLTAPSADEKEQ